MNDAFKNMRIVELVDESFAAYRAERMDEADRLYEQAMDLDTIHVCNLARGMVKGEVPDPNRQITEWAAYIEAARMAWDNECPHRMIQTPNPEKDRVHALKCCGCRSAWTLDNVPPEFLPYIHLFGSHGMEALEFAMAEGISVIIERP